MELSEELFVTDDGINSHGFAREEFLEVALNNEKNGTAAKSMLRFLLYS